MQTAAPSKANGNESAPAPPPALSAAPPRSIVPLLDADPESGRLLSFNERAVVSTLALPVHTVSSDTLDVAQLVAEEHAHGALVLDGMIVRRIAIDNRVALLLLGPGDLFMLDSEPQNAGLADMACVASVGTELALLDTAILLTAARRWPQILVGLLARTAEQTDRVAVQLAIGHLPSIEERLLAIMRLLAERWGYVTLEGTVIPLALTHATLGELAGARRPTVTLALTRLADRGALVRHANGWLLRRQSG